MLAPARLIVLKNSPTGFATFIGTPIDTRMGMRIIAAPTPPRAKTKAEIKEIIAILIVILNSIF